MTLASKILDWLSVREGESILPPGAASRRWSGVGGELLVSSRGDVIEVYAGGREMSAAWISPIDGRSLGWFLLWTVWARGSWCGIKTLLWSWAIVRAGKNAG